MGDLCPLLVRALHANKISALQLLRGGRVRVTVREPAFREELLSNDLIFEYRKIPVTPAGVHVVTLYVRDLPVVLSDETVKSVFSSYGEAYSVSHGYFKDFPNLVPRSHSVTGNVRSGKVRFRACSVPARPEIRSFLSLHMFVLSVVILGDSAE